jgi:hypothetical protein
VTDAASLPRNEPSAAPSVGRLERIALPLMGTLVALSIGCRAVSAFVRAFDRDEFQHLYTAWMMSVGLQPERDFELAGTYVPLLDGLRVAFRLFPNSVAPLFLARAGILLLGVSVLGLVYAVGRRLTSSRPAALLAVLWVTFYAEFIRRIGDIRSDVLNVLCVLAALYFLLAGAGRRPAILAGLALGFGLVSSPKVSVALGPLMLAGFLLYGRVFLRRALELLGAAAAVVLAYLLYLGASGLWEPNRRAFARFAEVATWGPTRVSPLPALEESARTNIAFVLVWLVCLALALGPGRWRGSGRLSAVVALFAALYPVLYFVANPVFYAYNFVDVVPIAALAIPAAAAGREERRGPAIARLACLLALLFAIAGGTATRWSLARGNALQLRYLDYIRAAIRPDERVFDLQGTHLFRRGPYHWHLIAIELPFYKTGKWFSIPEELRRFRVSLIVRTYRLHWLPKEDWDFVQSHYVWAEPLLMFPGHLFQARDGRSQSFEILVEGEYRFRSYRPEGATIDGGPVGERFRLSGGEHTLAFETSERPSFALMYTTPEREAHSLGAGPGEEIVPSTQ